MKLIDLEGLPAKGFFCIVAQHASSAWSEQCLEFAAYLFLIVLFPSTLIPATVLGLTMTLASLLFANKIGGLVDVLPRLKLARWGIVVQKSAQCLVYRLFLLLFYVSPQTLDLPTRSFPLHSLKIGRQLEADSILPAPDQLDTLNGKQWAILLALVACATVGRMSTTVLDLAVDRDWILIIGSQANNPHHLTILNASLRRAYLTTKLLSPLYVSLLTTSLSYNTCAIVLAAGSASSLVWELWWIGVVWKGWRCLEEDEERRRVSWAKGNRGRVEEGGYEMIGTEEDGSGTENGGGAVIAIRNRGLMQKLVDGVMSELRDLVEFARLPIFLSSVSISLLYLTTLQFDGIMLSYLKSTQHFSDVFISAMRGMCVVTGLAGTVVMPVGERVVGLVRAGAWSIWFEFFSLLPVVICLYASPTPSTPFTPLLTLFLFTSLALSRLGLYAFDLVQTQELQLALKDHPKRNRFVGVQVGMQSAVDLGKWGVVLVFNRPEEFRWTALISFISVALGSIVYTLYLYKTRGHLIHWGFKGHGHGAEGKDVVVEDDEVAEREREDDMLLRARDEA